MPRELVFQEAQAKSSKKTELGCLEKKRGRQEEAGSVATGLLKVRLSSIWHDTPLTHSILNDLVLCLCMFGLNLRLIFYIKYKFFLSFVS